MEILYKKFPQTFFYVFDIFSEEKCFFSVVQNTFIKIVLEMFSVENTFQKSSWNFTLIYFEENKKALKKIWKAAECEVSQIVVEENLSLSLNS